MCPVIQLPDWLTSTLASDAMGGEGAMDGPLPIRSGQLIAALATTVTVAAGDNLELQEVLRRGPDPGPVLVVASTGPSARATMGGLMALATVRSGFRAAIIDGRVRDLAEIRSLESLQVWCRGVTPVASLKDGGGQVGGEVRCAGVSVSPGDVVVADDDGVVVWPAARVEELLTKARARLESDRRREAEISAGRGFA
jgi:4-hydroxy-4-methyl-2-oxoglutarate aldolase